MGRGWPHGVGKYKAVGSGEVLGTRAFKLMSVEEGGAAVRSANGSDTDGWLLSWLWSVAGSWVMINPHRR